LSASNSQEFFIAASLAEQIELQQREEALHRRRDFEPINNPFTGEEV